MKYIDAEKLKAEIEKRMGNIKAYCLQPNHDKRYDVVPEQLAYILDNIDSLQQEQPEVDLENEINAVWNPRFNLGWDEHSALSMNHAGFASIARHFYELGRLSNK